MDLDPSASPQDDTAARFTAARRRMAEEDRLVLTSVGVDIGSSTSQLLFSRLQLERQDGRYVVVEREVLHQSDILLTPYRDQSSIDAAALGGFIDQQYLLAGVERGSVDTGALILTGVALLRDNARAIGDVFAAEAGRFVAVSAGDSLEAIMAAHGSGSVALSETLGAVMSVDIGGGTTKVAISRHGQVQDVMALNIGARLVAYDADGHITRLEPAGRDIGHRLGLELGLGHLINDGEKWLMAEYMADQLLGEVSVGGASLDSPLLRTAPLPDRSGIAAVTFSGGVSEFIWNRSVATFGDLGTLLGEELRRRGIDGAFGAPVVETPAGIRATAIGASQYTVQVSGSTIYVSPLDVLPVRNVPVVMPRFPWHREPLTAAGVSQAIGDALRRFDLVEASGTVAVAAHWEGSATYARISAFCAGALDALQARVDRRLPLVLVFDGDVGGLLGLHFRHELSLQTPIISIDGVGLREFDYIDIGELIGSTGAVPIVIKSLVFPTGEGSC
jgi:ethanolamine utilization protein EutA